MTARKRKPSRQKGGKKQKPCAKPSPSPGKRSRGLGLLILATAFAIGFVLWQTVSSRSHPPALTVSTNGLEPRVSALIHQSLEEARKAPQFGDAWGKLGMILYNYEQLSEAGRCFAWAARKSPDKARWPYLIGLIQANDSLASSVSSLEQAVQVSAQTDDAPNLQLASVYFELGRFEESSRIYRTLLTRRSDHVMARLGLARLEVEGDRLTEAQGHLDHCLDNPYTARQALGLLAVVHQRAGRVAEGRAAANRARTLPRDTPWPNSHLAELQQYHIGLKAWSDRAQSWLDQGRIAEAAKLIRQLVSEYPEDPGAWLLLGRIHLQEQRCPDAAQAFRRHLQLAPDSVNGYADLGIALLCQEKYAEAVTTLNRTLQLKPDMGVAHFNLGFALARLGRGEEAISAFRQAIRFSPDSVDPYITLADLLSQAGETGEAGQWLQRALAINPEEPRAKILLQRIGN